jgi:hypothetical protein
MAAFVPALMLMNSEFSWYFRFELIQLSAAIMLSIYVIKMQFIYVYKFLMAT